MPLIRFFSANFRCATWRMAAYNNCTLHGLAGLEPLAAAHHHAIARPQQAVDLHVVGVPGPMFTATRSAVLSACTRIT